MFTYSIQNIDAGSFGRKYHCRGSPRGGLILLVILEPNARAVVTILKVALKEKVILRYGRSPSAPDMISHVSGTQILFRVVVADDGDLEDEAHGSNDPVRSPALAIWGIGFRI